MEATIDARWVKGCNSLLEPSLLAEGEYQWGQNIDNAGGIVQTRQGWNAIGSKSARLPAKEPKGMAVFKDRLGRTAIIIAIGAELWACYYPFGNDFYKIGDGFVKNSPVIFCRAFKSTDLQSDGSLQVIAPYPILIMQNGTEKAKYWDGSTVSASQPSPDSSSDGLVHPGIPIGSWMQWSGNRLWVASGRILHASDLGNPTSFFEETYVAGGGALYFEDEITGLSQTPNFQTLLVCTDFNTSVVQSSQFTREAWSSTPDFQKVFLPGIGCAAGKSFVRQWGVVWWMSHGGLIALDQAINTYRTSRIHFRDQEMMKSKSNMSDDITGIVGGTFGNYLLMSVPSGDARNAHTWIMNQRGIDAGEVSPYAFETAEWSSNWIGLKPVDMASAIIGGKQRLFALSREDGDGAQDFYPNVWELFTGERQDRFNDHIFTPPCAFETRFLAMGQDLKRFDYAELDLAEIRGKVSLQVYVASRRGGYHKIFDQQLVASEGSINSNINSNFTTATTASVSLGATSIPVTTTTGSLPAPATININGMVIRYAAKSGTVFTVNGADVTAAITNATQVTQPQFAYPNPATLVTSYVPQRRIVRTANWIVKESEPSASNIESNLPDNLDRAFSILVKWTGRMAITGMRIFTSKVTEPKQGDCAIDELNARFIDETGGGSVSSTVVEPPTIDSARLTSQYLRIITPKHLDDTYRPVPAGAMI